MSAPDTASSTARLDLGRPVGVVRTRLVSGRVELRLVAVCTALLALAAAGAVASITFGDYPLTLQDVMAVLTGGGERFHRTIVLGWRLPVAIAAVVFGAPLGIGGAVFQSLTRNPLGSPDVIGFDSGSYFAVVVMMLVLGTTSYWDLAAASVIGGVLTALVVYLLSYRQGVQGFRLIIVGIGVSAMLGSLNAYLITRADIDSAMSVGFWGAGSISRVGWDSMIPCLLIAVVMAVAAGRLAPSLRRLELGDDAAATLGTRVGPARLGLIVLGVATSAVVTAAAGPIGFIALVAPQLARRVTRTAGVSLAGSAAMGAVLLTAAHLLCLFIAQLYRPVPVGLITVCVGGLYLLWLLLHEARRTAGGPH